MVERAQWSDQTRARAEYSMAEADAWRAGQRNARSPCPIVARVQDDLQRRAETGLRKYGTTLARTDLDLHAWLQHAYEEALDLACYLRRAMDEAREPNGDEVRG